MQPRTVGIVDYGLGNLTSVAGAVEKIGHRPLVTADADTLGDADRLILPGVGAFGDGMEKLRARGLVEVLERLVRGQGRPILGICLGAQLMTRGSEEFGDHEGLGWLPAAVRRLRPADPALRVPHVGWDDLERTRDCPLFDGVEDGALVYYVHGYCIHSEDPSVVAGECEYGERFASALHDGNVFATQFHPEKSQLAGISMLRNFVEGS